MLSSCVNLTQTIKKPRNNLGEFTNNHTINRTESKRQRAKNGRFTRQHSHPTLKRFRRKKTRHSQFKTALNKYKQKYGDPELIDPDVSEPSDVDHQDPTNIPLPPLVPYPTSDVDDEQPVMTPPPDATGYEHCLDCNLCTDEEGFTCRICGERELICHVCQEFAKVLNTPIIFKYTFP